MSTIKQPITRTDLIRFLQIGMVLEEIIEARSYQHQNIISNVDGELASPIDELLEEAHNESVEHRTRLEQFIRDLDSDHSQPEEVRTLVNERYSRSEPENAKDILFDQLHGERSAHRYYSMVLNILEENEIEEDIDIDFEELISTIEQIKNEEAQGVRETIHILGITNNTLE